MENKKKRKAEDQSDDDDDDELLDMEEERKMDKFYSLLRSFRDARDRRRKELEELNQKRISTETNKKSKTKTSPHSNIWVPSFEQGDFTTEVEFRKPPWIFPSPSSTSTPASQCEKHKGKKDQHQDDTLDLNLSL